MTTVNSYTALVKLANEAAGCRHLESSVSSGCALAGQLDGALAEHPGPRPPRVRGDRETRASSLARIEHRGVVSAHAQAA